MSSQTPRDDEASRWRRVEEICDAALRLPEAGRDAYLAAACGDDQGVRREVEALLAHERAADGFLSAPLGAVAAAVVEPPRHLVGRSIGGYDIVAKIGEGGMGEVYRARDRKLGRDVAIKVLPAALTNDRERLKRFEREARLLASVNHPRIGSIYGVIDVDDVRALVLELIEGDTLSTVLARGPLKVERALTLAAQIADALDHAHRRGVTHRDLKPSNIMLSDGGVKVLDFGVGKWSPPLSGETLARPSTLTNEGAIVGTLNYMSPEQLEGRATDTRSDIFSFGAVVYEMLCGRRAFDGPSQASIIAAVLEAPTPKLTGFASPITPRLERVVTKCLAKNPDDRWQTARDLADELTWLATEPAITPSTDELKQRVSQSRRRPLIAVLSGTAAVVAVAILGWSADWRRPHATPPASPIGFSVQPVEATLNGGDFDISSDGTQLLYSASGAFYNSNPGSTYGSSLFLRRLDRFDTVLLPGSERFISPVFSPNGEWVAFFDADRTLRKMRLGAEAGPVVVVEDIGTTFQIRWPTADTMLLAGREQPIRRLPAIGGRPVDVTTLQPAAEVDHHSPTLLPSGNGLLFAVHGKRNRFSIVVQDLRSGQRHTLFESGFAPIYSPTGHLLFGRGSAIMAVPFDERTLTIRGDPIRLVENVSTDPDSGDANYRVSANGTLVYQPRRLTDGRVLTWVDRNGQESPVGTPARAFNSPRVSRDGKHLAFLIQDSGRQDIWTYEIASGKLSPLTQDGDALGLVWTPDSTAVIYGRNGATASEVLLHRLKGQMPEVLATSVDDNLWPSSITNDGRQVIITAWPPTDDWYVVQAAGASTQPGIILKNPGLPRAARLSPDNRWLAYTENFRGRTQVFIQGYPEPGLRRQISVEGGRQPVWRHDGKELFFRSGSRMFAVSIDTSAGLTPGKPTLLFTQNHVVTFMDYDVAPDGRFLMIKPAPAEGTDSKLNVMVNWRTDLLARVPVQ